MLMSLDRVLTTCRLLPVVLLLAACHGDDNRHPPPTVASIEVTPASDYVLVGGTLQLSATVKDSQGAVLTDRTLTWTSSNPAILTVSSSGLVSGVTRGAAMVSVSTDGYSAVANVTVTSLSMVRITAPTYALRPGDTTQLTATVLDSANRELPVAVTWSSADDAIAMVSSAGSVSAVADGVVAITASAGAAVARVRIAVQQPIAGKIAFISKRGRIVEFTQAGGIYLMDPDGAHQSLLIEDPFIACSPDPGVAAKCYFPWGEPTIASDGLRLAATARVNYDIEFSGVMIHLCATAQPLCTPLDYRAEVRDYSFPRLALVGVSAPDWSPDGTRIVFAKAGISVWDSATGLVSEIEPSDSSLQPVWSPDGGRIAFVSARSGNRDIWVMNADGSQQANLTNSDAGDDSQPAWAADGRIAFVSNRDGNAEIYVMNEDGSSQTNLTHNAANDLDPDWSPDGSRIAFQTGRDGNSEIYVMYADGTSPTNLTNHPAEDTSPAWTP